MRRLRVNKKIALIFAALALVLVLAPSFVGATDGVDSKTGTTVQNSKVNDTNKVTTETKSPAATNTTTGSAKTTEPQKATEIKDTQKVVARERLSDVKLKVCVNREAQVNTIMGRVVTRSEAEITHITAVADRTKAFYEKQGNTVNTYAGLVSAVEAARVAAQSAVNSLTADATFSCKSDGPKSDIQAFHAQRLTKVSAIGAYRDSVKALIAAVKAAQPKTEAKQ